MRKENWFYLVILMTILIARLSVFLFPNTRLYINNIHIHHIWYGFILVLLALFLKKYKIIFYVYSIGLGLVIDELFFIILLNGNPELYFNVISIFGVILLAIIFYFFRKKIMNFLIR